MPSQRGLSVDDPITLMDDEYQIADIIDLEHFEEANNFGEVLIIDDSDDSDHEVEIIEPIVSKKRPIKLRNQPPQHPWQYIDSTTVEEKKQELGPRGSRITIGDTIEFVSADSSRNDFLRVFHILRNAKTGEIRLRGLRFRRHQFIAPLLTLTLNEVCLHARIYSGQIDERPYVEQGLHEIPVNLFVKKRRLIVTDRPFPELSWRESISINRETPDIEKYYKCKQQIFDGEVLVCRTIFIQTYEQGMDLKGSQRQCQNELRRLTLYEADDGNGLLKGPSAPSVDAQQMPSSPIGPTSPLKRKRDVERKGEIELAYDEDMRRHTFGDVFCGAGGASCGAKMAGLKVIFGVDNDKLACEAFRKNFVNAEVCEKNAQDYVAEGKPENEIEVLPHVDILHLSPPCQFFSPAHTTAGKNDEKNSAAIFSVGPLVQQVRPRIATMEETNGLTHNKHIGWFYSMLSGVHKQGYSVRWAVIRCLAYGCTQPRPRLFMIASAPGVPLPPFPRFTHGPPERETYEKGLQQFTSLRAAADNIPQGTTQHNPEDPDLKLLHEEPPRDPDLHSKRTLLTNNESDVYHWDGKRKYTIRELACLQGFPLNHEFTGNRADMRRQIGNAVPPMVYQKIIRECREVLKRVDQDRATRRRLDSPDIIPIEVERLPEAADITVIQSVEDAMNNPIFPPIVAMTPASHDMRQRDTSITVGPGDNLPPGDVGQVIVIDDEPERDLVLADGAYNEDDEAPMPEIFYITSTDEKYGHKFAATDNGNFTAPLDTPSRSSISMRYRRALSAPCEGSGAGSKDVTSEEEGERRFSGAVARRVFDQGSGTVSREESRYVTPSEGLPLTSTEDVNSEIQYVTVYDDDEVNGGTVGSSTLQTGSDFHAVSTSPAPDPSIRARGMMRTLSLNPDETEAGDEVGGEVQGSGAVVIVIDDD
ncbi:S-adenosyl-L-methionine-dependent methyltransferase [Phyllosticta capitalensis]